jgi:hypothetical protein
MPPLLHREVLVKVLFTGMASSHCKPSKNTTFFRLVSERVEQYASVEWLAPSLTWDKDFFEQYDAVFVGILPPTSPSANKVYGAMHTINILFDSPKLNLVIDHPQLWQFKHSFNAVDRNVLSLFSDFYSKRKEFSAAKEIISSISEANLKLLTKPWPTTIYPELPWKSDRDLNKLVSLTADSNLIGLNLDHWLLSESTALVSNLGGHWITDNPDTSWTKEVSEFLELPIVSIKQRKQLGDADALTALQASGGFLFSPQERGVGTWWSYRLIQALNSGIPVLSNWKETHQLGPEWNLLAFELENLSPEDKILVAKAQKESYIQAIPDKKSAQKQISFILDKSMKGKSNA